MSAGGGPPGGPAAACIVRPETPADVAAIHRVHTVSFPTPAEARLVDALRAAGRLTVSLLAVDGNVVVGHVAFSPVTLERSAAGLGLAPVAVLRTHRRRSVAADLIRAGLARCRATGSGFVVLLGEPDYYARFGFRPASAWRLQDEYGGGAAFQALELAPHAIPSDGGLVRYAPEFAALG